MLSTAFVEFFGLPDHFISELEKVPHLSILNHYQAIIRHSFQNHSRISLTIKPKSTWMPTRLSIPRSRFIIQMPTGSGKTRTTMEIIANHIKKSEDGVVVFWLAHSSELCEQAYQCFIEVWQYLADRPLKAVRCWGSHPVPSAYEKSMFIVGGFQKVHSILRKDENAFECCKTELIDVVDELTKPSHQHTKQPFRS